MFLTAATKEIMSCLSKEALQQKYDKAARWYDRAESMLDWPGVGRLRRELLAKAFDDVFEMAVSNGKILPHYPRGCTITAVDLSPDMLAVAREQSASISMWTPA